MTKRFIEFLDLAAAELIPVDDDEQAVIDWVRRVVTKHQGDYTEKLILTDEDKKQLGMME